MYFVILPSGQQFGPADHTLLAQWASEGRITPTTTLRDVQTGATLLATAIPGLFPASPAPLYNSPTPYSAYPRPRSGPLYDPSSQSDVNTAWVFAALGLLCCGPVAILGILRANNALAKGNPNGRAPQILSYVALGLWIVLTVARLLLRGSGF